MVKEILRISDGENKLTINSDVQFIDFSFSKNSYSLSPGRLFSLLEKAFSSNNKEDIVATISSSVKENNGQQPL